MRLLAKVLPERQEHGHEQLVLGPSGARLDFDERVEVQNPKAHRPILEKRGVRRKLIITTAVVETTERINRSEGGREIELALTRKMLPRRAQLPLPRFPKVGIKPLEQSEQPIDVLRGASMNNVQVLGCCWRTMQHRGCTTYDNEFHPCISKGQKQGVEVGITWMHGGGICSEPVGPASRPAVVPVVTAPDSSVTAHDQPRQRPC